MQGLQRHRPGAGNNNTKKGKKNGRGLLRVGTHRETKSEFKSTRTKNALGRKTKKQATKHKIDIWALREQEKGGGSEGRVKKKSKRGIRKDF